MHVDWEITAMAGDNRTEALRVQQEIESELRRGGVDPAKLDEALFGPLPTGPQADSGGLAGIGFDAMAFLAVLRELPDDAGTSAFLTSLSRDQAITLRGSRRDTHG